MRAIQTTDITETVQGIADRIDASLNFAEIWVPGDCRTPHDLFYLLKSATTFKHDKPGVEQIQSMQTLFTNNIHGLPGAGDCDCLTVAACASLHVIGYNCGLVLQGNGKYATHVLAYYVGPNGKTYPFDLTENFNELRPYKKSQFIKINF